MASLRIPGVEIDKFTGCGPNRVVLLSHFHSDHYSGLSNSFRGKICCTGDTKTALQLKYDKIPDECFEELEYNECKTIAISSSHSDKVLTVTAIDANHCPGSAMFLIEHTFNFNQPERIFWTGDFRYDSSKMDSILENMIAIGGPVHHLFLDTTFFKEEFSIFPSKEECANHVIKLCERYKQKPVYLSCDYFGSEFLVEKVSDHFGALFSLVEMKKDAEKEEKEEAEGKKQRNREEKLKMRIQELQTFAASHVTDDEDHKTRFHCVGRRGLYNRSNENGSINDESKCKSLCIQATAMWSMSAFADYKSNFSKSSKTPAYLKGAIFAQRGGSHHFVLFSGHSSKLEIEKFIKKVNPMLSINTIERGAAAIDSSCTKALDSFLPPKDRRAALLRSLSASPSPSSSFVPIAPSFGAAAHSVSPIIPSSSVPVSSSSTKRGISSISKEKEPLIPQQAALKSEDAAVSSQPMPSSASAPSSSSSLFPVPLLSSSAPVVSNSQSQPPEQSSKRQRIPFIQLSEHFKVYTPEKPARKLVSEKSGSLGSDPILVGDSDDE